MNLVPFVKHPGFQEENEERLCRMVVTKYQTENDQQSIKITVSGQKHNICMKFETLPIEKIIIGPCKNQKEQEDKESHLRAWLDSNGYPNMIIGRSDIPYVGQYR